MFFFLQYNYKLTLKKIIFGSGAFQVFYIFFMHVNYLNVSKN